MKNILLIIFFVFQINCYCQDCDSVLFNQLMYYNTLKSVSDKELIVCRNLVDSLSDQHCYFYEKNNQAISSLTFEFGKICLKANSDQGVKLFIEYLIKNRKRGSAEEQLSFSFEYLFEQQPENVMNEMAKLDNSTKDQLIGELCWGFCNNHLYGKNDPLQDDPFKAMTVFSNPPKEELDSTTYKEIFYSMNSDITKIYPKYKIEIDNLLDCVLEETRFYYKMKSKYKN